MNTRFCPSCGNPNRYTVTKPKSCVGCNTNLDQAFATAPVATPVKSNALVRAPRTLQRQDRSTLATQISENDDDFDDADDSYDDGEAHALARDWQQQVDASMFFQPTKGGPIKLGQLDNVRQAAEKMVEAAEKPKKSRSRK